MLELARSDLRVVSCFGRAAELDALRAPDGAVACRVAPDELLLVGPAVAVDGIPAALALDTTDAYAVWTLAGPGAPEAFARLSAIPPAPGFAQGAIAGVPGKAVVLAGRIHVLVPSTYGHHLRDRVVAACADLL